METFLLSVVGIIIYVVIYKIAVSKNRNPVVWILICVIATPFCIIILLLLDKLPQDSMMKRGDQYKIPICNNSGTIAIYDKENKQYYIYTENYEKY